MRIAADRRRYFIRHRLQSGAEQTQPRGFGQVNMARGVFASEIVAYVAHGRSLFPLNRPRRLAGDVEDAAVQMAMDNWRRRAQFRARDRNQRQGNSRQPIGINIKSSSLQFFEQLKMPSFIFVNFCIKHAVIVRRKFNTFAVKSANFRSA